MSILGIICISIVVGTLLYLLIGAVVVQVISNKELGGPKGLAILTIDSLEQVFGRKIALDIVTTTPHVSILALLLYIVIWPLWITG